MNIIPNGTQVYYNQSEVGYVNGTRTIQGELHYVITPYWFYHNPQIPLTVEVIHSKVRVLA